MSSVGFFPHEVLSESTLERHRATTSALLDRQNHYYVTSGLVVATKSSFASKDALCDIDFVWGVWSKYQDAFALPAPLTRFMRLRPRILRLLQDCIESQFVGRLIDAREVAADLCGGNMARARAMLDDLIGAPGTVLPDGIRGSVERLYRYRGLRPL